MRFKYVGNLSEKWNLEEKSSLLKFLLVYGAGALKDSYIDFSLRVKSIFRAAPQITTKSPPNAPETGNHYHTRRMNCFIAFQHILGTI